MVQQHGDGGEEGGEEGSEEGGEESSDEGGEEGSNGKSTSVRATKGHFVRQKKSAYSAGNQYSYIIF